MTEQRAYAINRAIVGIGMMSVLGFDAGNPDIKLLRQASLREMLDAVDFVKLDNDTKPADANGTRTHSMVPDPRLTAAVYTALHYSVGPNEDDDLVVGYPEGGRIHLLIAAVRDRSVLAEAEEAAA